MANWNAIEIASTTGATLNAYLSVPKGRPKAFIQINHGLAEHADRYQRFAEFLVKRGYGVIAHDHRGHGKTHAADAAQGHFSKTKALSRVVSDIDAVNKRIAKDFKSVPIICFGHSMGGILAFVYILQHPQSVAGCAVWNTNIQNTASVSLAGMILRVERLFKGSDTSSTLAGKLTFETWNRPFRPNRTAFDWLSRDEAEVDRYIEDPLCGFDATVGTWLTILEAVRFGADRGNWHDLPADLPLNLVGGAADPVSENGTAMANLANRLRETGKRDIAIRVYEDTRHEGLNEVNRDTIMSEFADWLDARWSS